MSATKEINKFKKIFNKNRERSFFIDILNGKEFTYGEIENLSLKLASLLAAKGIRKSDKIAIVLPNCIEFVILYFACMQLGAIPVPINHRLNLSEVEYILLNSKAKVIFISPIFFNKLYEICNAKGILLFCFEPDKLINNKSTLSGLVNFDFFKEINALDPYSDSKGIFGEITDDDAAIIIYTSGTTARPKGVVISYGNIINHGSLFVKLLGLEPSLRFYGSFALSYLGGFDNLLIIPMLGGSTIVLDRAFDAMTAINFWNNVKQYNINALWLVPSMLSIILSIDRSSKSQRIAKRIKLALVGTAPLPSALKGKFEEKYGLTLYENYGTSETLIVTVNSPGSSFIRGVGKIMPGRKILIINQKGENCGVNELGEIVVKTKYMNNWYYENPTETKQAFKDDMFYTGDMGHLDEDGYLFITDRKKDLIIRGGINISPQEIEEIISKYPSVSGVAVVGIPHSVQGEEIVALVVSAKALAERAIQEYCHKHLAPFKIPQHILFTEELPRGVTGKIQKNKVKELAMKLLKNV